MNIRGNTAAASAISAPLLSAASFRVIETKDFNMSGDNSCFPENPIKQYGERQRNSVRNF
jgi:hypothetical protein